MVDSIPISDIGKNVQVMLAVSFVFLVAFLIGFIITLPQYPGIAMMLAAIFWTQIAQGMKKE